MENSRRKFLQSVACLAASDILAQKLSAFPRSEPRSSGKAILVVFGGVRWQETFSKEGFANIPHLVQDLAPQSLFYRIVRNDGVTAHFNAVSSILTGVWQRVDDWGKFPPTSPTIFEYFRKELNAPQNDTWIVASNKALTSQIGASSASHYGQPFGANVIFPKQILITALVNAITAGRRGSIADHKKVQAELEAVLDDTNYEGLGSVFDAPGNLNPQVRSTMEEAISHFVRSQESTSGDELTFWVSREIMRRFAPSLLVVIFSDVEVAHLGSYSLHLAGIRTGDRLTHQLWQEAQQNSEYRGRTTMVVLPEFGRDPDGSNTNGFLNHRSNGDSCRNTWMMVLGAGVDRPRIIERPVQHIDVCSTLGKVLGCGPLETKGQPLVDLRL